MKVVVTGSSTGIGRALSLELLKNGHSVWGVARSTQSDLAKAYPNHFKSSCCDVTHWEAINAVSKTIAQTWGIIDGLVTAAGIQGEIARALSADPIAWSNTVRSNIDGTYFPLRAFSTLLKPAQGRAKVVCFSGGGATKSRPYFSAYGSAKTAIVRLVETIAEEEKNRAFDITCIAPGAINTRLTDEVITKGPAQAGESEYAAALKQKENGGQSLDKAIALITWLLSSQSDGLSGKLVSAQWDPWLTLNNHIQSLVSTDIYTLRRILPDDRKTNF